MKNRHTLSVLVEDHPGVLNRVVSLLRRRSFNIDSITVGHSEQPGISRMTIVVIGQDEEGEQAVKQLYKLMEVLKVTDVTSLNCVAHEMALVKVAAKSQTRSAFFHRRLVESAGGGPGQREQRSALERSREKMHARQGLLRERRRTRRAAGQ